MSASPQFTKLRQYLGNVSKGMRGKVRVGFMEGSTYPDGTPVPAVAFWNEYGGPGRPERPFFRRMIAKDSPKWAPLVGKAAVAANYDSSRVLAILGDRIKGELQASINQFQDPPISQETAERKGFKKPLIDTAVMLNSITFEVDD